MAHISLDVGGQGSPNSRPPPVNSVGHGQIFDSGGLSSSSALPSYNAGGNTYRSQYHLDQSEILKGLANRFVHSTAYLYLYGTMALASLLTVVMSIANDCPGTLFYVVEMIVNIVLVVEVAIRFVAFGRQFWHSTFNILDLFLVFLCTLTLTIIFFSHDCSPYNRNNPSKGRGGRQGKGEELLDSFLLIFRNGMQLMRLLAVVRRSGRNAFSRPSRIEVGNASRGGGGAAARSQDPRSNGPGIAGRGGAGGGAADLTLDIDLEDDERATRNRIRDGGGGGMGVGAGARGDKRGTEREGLMHGHDYDEEEEEEL